MNRRRFLSLIGLAALAAPVTKTHCTGLTVAGADRDHRRFRALALHELLPYFHHELGSNDFQVRASAGVVGAFFQRTFGSFQELKGTARQARVSFTVDHTDLRLNDQFEFVEPVDLATNTYRPEYFTAPYTLVSAASREGKRAHAVTGVVR